MWLLFHNDILLDSLKYCFINLLSSQLLKTLYQSSYLVSQKNLARTYVLFLLMFDVLLAQIIPTLC